MSEALDPEQKKELLLKTVRQNPGLTAPQLTKIAGLPGWAGQAFLPQLEQRRLVRSFVKSDRHRVRMWYAVPECEKTVLPTKQQKVLRD